MTKRLRRWRSESRRTRPSTGSGQAGSGEGRGSRDEKEDEKEAGGVAGELTGLMDSWIFGLLEFVVVLIIFAFFEPSVKEGVGQRLSKSKII